MRWRKPRKEPEEATAVAADSSPPKPEGKRRATPKWLKVAAPIIIATAVLFAAWFFVFRNKGGEPAATTPAVASTTSPPRTAPTPAPIQAAHVTPASPGSWSGSCVRSGTECGALRTTTFIVSEPGYGPVEVELSDVYTPSLGAEVPGLASRASSMLVGRQLTITSATKIPLGGAGQDVHRYEDATVEVGGKDLAEMLVSAGLAVRRL